MNKESNIVAVSKPQEKKEFTSTEKLKQEADKALKEKVKQIIDEQDIDKAIGFIQNKVEEEKSLIELKFNIVGFYPDVAYQIQRAITLIYGFSSSLEKRISGNVIQDFIPVKLADGSVIDVLVGKINLPELGKDSFFDIFVDEDRPVTEVTAVVEKRFSSIIKRIINKTKELLRTESLYKNSAIIIKNDLTPQFLTVSSLPKLYLSKEVEYNLIPLKARLSQLEDVNKLNLSSKYSVLLYGNYGTGKTLIASHMLKFGIENGYTAIYIENSNYIERVIDIINVNSSPEQKFILFIEDIDQIFKKGRRNKINSILNKIDGIDNKGTNIITIYTTNHLEEIDPTLLRGKRISQIIEVGELDTQGYTSYLLDNCSNYIEKDDIVKIAKILEEEKVVPAFLAEIVDKIKALSYFTKKVLTHEEVSFIISSYLKQIRLADIKNNEPKNPVISAIEFIQENVKEFIQSEIDHIMDSK